jgi:hypothetical protein
MAGGVLIWATIQLTDQKLGTTVPHMPESPRLLLAEDEEQLKRLICHVQAVLNFLVSWLPDSFRAGVTAFAISLIGVGLELVPGARIFGLVLTAIGGFLGILVVLLTIVHEVRRRTIGAKLAEFMVRADDLTHSLVTTQEAYSQWVHDLSAWYRETNDYLLSNLSVADAAIFRDTSAGGRYATRGFNAEHMDYKNTLQKLIANLKTITERFLSGR